MVVLLISFGADPSLIDGEGQIKEEQFIEFCSFVRADSHVI